MAVKRRPIEPIMKGQERDLTRALQKAEGFAKGNPIFAGIDVHKQDRTVHLVFQEKGLCHSTVSLTRSV